MELHDYRKYTISTLNGYPLKYKKYLKDLFIEKGIAQDDSQMALGITDAIDISGLDLPQQLNLCVENNEKCLDIIERWEFEKDYKYSVLFKVKDFDALLKNIDAKAIAFSDKYAPLFGSITDPQFWKYDRNISLLKFNYRFEAVHPKTAEELFVRYPIVVAFHLNCKIIEIRFDALKRFFMEKSDNFYYNLVEDICSYIHCTYDQILCACDLDFLVNKVQHSETGAILVAQSMKMANGSSAQLEVGKNEEFILPFIGELKNFLTDYAIDFEKVPALKEGFEQFIFEKEATSEYPWIELLWENEIKTRSLRVKVTFNYCQKGYCLLQHYFNNALIGMERMNHVVRFIYEVKGNS